MPVPSSGIVKESTVMLEEAVVAPEMSHELTKCATGTLSALAVRYLEMELPLPLTSMVASGLSSPPRWSTALARYKRVSSKGTL
jgi:hypothetical protein